MFELLPTSYLPKLLSSLGAFFSFWRGGFLKKSRFYRSRLKRVNQSRKEKGREPMFQFALEKASLPFQHKTPARAELFRLPLLF